MASSLLGQFIVRGKAVIRILVALILGAVVGAIVIVSVVGIPGVSNSPFSRPQAEVRPPSIPPSGTAQPTAPPGSVGGPVGNQVEAASTVYEGVSPGVV